MEQKNEVRPIQLQELRSRIDKGLAKAEHGESADSETFMRELIENLDSAGAKRKAGLSGYILTPAAQEDLIDIRDWRNLGIESPVKCWSNL